MKTCVNRWSAAVAWVLLMGVVGAFFVPSRLSGTMFALVALSGLLASLFGSALLGDWRSRFAIQTREHVHSHAKRRVAAPGAAWISSPVSSQEVERRSP